MKPSKTYFQTHILTLTILLLSFSSVTAQIFVNGSATGTNDGSSWDNAFTELKIAIDAADNNDTIWIAEGEYRYQHPNGPDSSFYIINKSLYIFGGFQGNETTLDQRDWESHATTLSGDLNGDDIRNDAVTNKSDNAYHLFYSYAPVLLLDGLSLSNGHTRLDDIPSGVTDRAPWRGAAIYATGSGLILRNTTFKNNHAFYGGAIYCSRASTSMDNCTFLDNTGENWGGGVSIGNGDISITNSTFENNASTGDGGAIFIWQNDPNDDSEINLMIDNCMISENSSGRDGGGIAINLFGDGLNAAISKCQFLNNTASNFGGGIRVFSTRPRAVSYQNNLLVNFNMTDFHGNSAVVFGGALAVTHIADTATIKVENCNFMRNECTRPDRSYGGAIGFFSSSNTSFIKFNTEIVNCNFELNSTGYWGGGVYWEGNTSTNFEGLVRSSNFNSNYTSQEFGALTIYRVDSATLDNCTFTDNITPGGGGGVASLYCSRLRGNGLKFINNTAGVGNALYLHTVYDCTFTNSLFQGNNEGSCVDMIVTQSKFSNSTFIDNSIALFQRGSSKIILQNTLLADNEVNFTEVGEDNYVESKGGNLSSDVTLNSELKGYMSYEDLNETDPMIDMDGVPQEGSPAIDAGNPEGITGATDLAGNSRIQGGGIDIGAYETSPTTSTQNSQTPSESLATLIKNPVQDILKLKFHISFSDVSIKVYDTKGVEVFHSDKKVIANSIYNFYLDKNVAPGIHIIQISDGDRVQSIPFIKS